MEPCRGSAAALSGSVCSPPTSTAGLLRSREQVTYLYPVSASQPANGFDHAGSKRNSVRARCNYVTAQKEKCLLSFHSLLCFWGMGGGKEALRPFCSAPRVLLWVLCRIFPGGTRWAVRETIDYAFNLAGGFLSFKLGME